jgi:hypothetical protein
MIMERTEVLDLMRQLKLFGMKNAGACPRAGEARTRGTRSSPRHSKRQHEPQRFAGDLLKAEISEKQARSIKYQLTIAKLPLAKPAPGEGDAETGGEVRAAVPGRGTGSWGARPP